MRRKSERNKAKGTPEKKVEKPTRRTTRRRGKASPSTSPERENADDNVTSTPYSDEDKESRLQPEEQSNDNEDSQKGVSSSELIKSVLGGDEEDNGSVWKVARADASPGEIQKLKLCRQRNTSEASDSSSSKKKSNKWPDSGEGCMEEADSSDEQIASSQMPISEQSDDPSSSHPGQDSNEEVSDYKENLPETTSANLSDDKPNIDQQADSKENLPETTSTNLSEPPNYEDNQSSSPSTNLPADNSNLGQSPDCGDNAVDITSEENLPVEQQNEDYQENSNEQACLNSTASDLYQSVDTNSNMHDNNTNEVSLTEGFIQNNEETTIDQPIATYENETIVEETSTQDMISEKETPLTEDSNTEVVSINNETASVENSKDSKDLKNEEEEEEEGEIREETEKDRSPESDSVSNVRDEPDTQDIQESVVESPVIETHSRRKHEKYHESSTSDTPGSDDEKTPAKDKKAEKKEADSSNAAESTKKNKKEKKNESKKSRSFETENSFSVSNEPELDLTESNAEKDDILEINEKSDDLNVSLSTSKPAKVSLKRSFSTRLSTDSEVKKEENGSKNPIVNESNQNKENHADNEQPDQKCATKRRRWGTTTTSDAAPSFSISTDSLKALVPGAKPLAANEVKLTKDEDEEKEHRKSKNESAGDHKSKNDTLSKSDSKKGDAKAENHISSRRKITLVKEAPRPKSPSPPEAQATNILLIKNLVRPFTLNQIKELLSRTGTILENGFWMDRIKSKCFVEYANEDQAFETRQALHGVSWPLSNPKKLIVEYATKEDMEAARETTKDQPIARKAEPLLAADLWQQDRWSRDERPPVVNKITVIREWDLGKEDGQLHVKEKERERERKEFEKKKRQRSRSPIVEAHLPAPARKFKKKEEDPPTAKLLDDLFRKTKATPCIYWLPLTNEQIIVKEEMRRQHMAEHARRLEEMRRAERNRDSRRRRSPRK